MRRIAALVRRSKDHVAIIAPPEFGGDTLLSGFVRRGVPTVHLSFRGGAEGANVLYGNRLSDALEEALGFRLFGYGVPLSYGIAVLRSQVHLLGRLTVAIASADEGPPEAMQPLLDCDPRQIQVVASFADLPKSVNAHFATQLHSADLAMTYPEAEAAAKHVLLKPEIERLWRQSRGAYLEFISRVNRMSSLPPLPVVASAKSVPTDAARQLVTMFVRQARWLEALEVAVEHDADEAIEIFRRGTPLMMDQGLFDRLWVLIEKLDPQRFEADDELFYWYFAVATAVNKHRTVARRVRTYLRRHEAPDLRARWAVAFPSSTSLEDASRAYRAQKNVNTARALGFVLTMSSRSEEAVQTLKQALEIAESTEDGRQVCATALDISHSLVHQAHYSSAKSWAQWGIARYNQLHVGDELLRLSLVNQLAYLNLLTDEVGAAEEGLAAVTLPDELLGTPMIEGLVSTFGDVAYVKGELEAALSHYQRNYDHYPRASVGFAALDVVKAMIVIGQVDGARALLRQSVDVNPGDQGPSDLALKLASAHISSASEDKEHAKRQYQSVAAGNEGEPSAYFATQAILGLALVYFMSGEARQARAILNQERSLWEDLGRSGWILMTVDRVAAGQLWQLAQGEEATDQFRFLGDRLMIREGKSQHLSLRHAELASVLAFEPGGYSSEALLLELYGEEGRLGSLKALLSRARDTFPIRARPYRLETSFRCDFVDLEELLENGRLREALELYKGPLLPESEAPGVRRARERIDEAVRQAVLHAGEWDLALRLARKFPDDLELWEEAERLAPKNDPAYPLIRARVRRIRGEWGL